MCLQHDVPQYGWASLGTPIVRPSSHALSMTPAGRRFCKRLHIGENLSRLRMARISCYAITRSAPHAIRYRPITPGAFKQMMTAIPTDLSRFSFVDFGSGKGRVLLLASHLPFREVIGVEFSAKLHRIAERNIASYPATKRILSRPRAVEADATKFDLPNGPLVLYFYNPFGAPILEQVLRRAEMHPAPIFAAYNRPVWRKLVDRSERWREVNRRATSWVNFERI